MTRIEPVKPIFPIRREVKRPPRKPEPRPKPQKRLKRYFLTVRIGNSTLRYQARTRIELNALLDACNKLRLTRIGIIKT